MELQNRDKEILTLCYEQRFLLIKHVSDYFFKGNYGEAKRRVRELKEAKLVQDASIQHGRSKVLELTKYGRQLADSYSRVGPLPRYDLDPASLEHNAIVTEARILIQKLWDGYWVPEHALRPMNSREIPDGIFVFSETEHHAVIEIENSLKGRARFEDRIKRWHHGQKVALVVFVATNEQIYKHLTLFLEAAPRYPTHVVMMMDELKLAEPTGWSPHLGDVLPFNRRTY